MSEKCPDCGRGDRISNEVNSEIRKKTYSCGHGFIIATINEPMEIPEKIIPRITFHFKLLNPLYIGGKIVSSYEIKLKTDQGGTHLLEFDVTVQANDIESARNLAIQKATQLTNMLSVKVGFFVYHDRPEMSIVQNGVTTRTKSFKMDVVLVKKVDFDLTNPPLSNIIDKDSKLNQQLAHSSRALNAMEENDPVVAIREFSQVIESENFLNQEKYRCLRHAVNDNELNDDVVNILKKEFDIDYVVDNNANTKYVDYYNSPQIMEKLRIASQTLKTNVLSYLNKAIGI